MKQRKGLLLYAGLILSFAGCLVFCLKSYPVILQSIDSKNWHSINATVINSYVNSGAGKNNDLYQLVFRAEYEVNGKKFILNRRYLGSEWASSWEGDKFEFVDAHPEGSTINVFYNPDKPYQATTETGFKSQYLIMIGISLIMFISGIIAFYKILYNPVDTKVAPVSQMFIV